MEPIVLVVVPPCWKATCHHFSPWGCNKLIIRTGILDACRVCVQENGADGRVCMPQSVADWQSAPLTARGRHGRQRTPVPCPCTQAQAGRQGRRTDVCAHVRACQGPCNCSRVYPVCREDCRLNVCSVLQYVTANWQLHGVESTPNSCARG